jgi:hypothetical protein
MHSSLECASIDAQKQVAFQNGPLPRLALVLHPGTAWPSAGTFETFIRDAAKLTKPPPDEEAKAFAAHGMKDLGPPLKVD